MIKTISPGRKQAFNPKLLGLVAHSTDDGGIAVYCPRTRTKIEVRGKEIPLLIGLLKNSKAKLA